jgi:hypothetical protein
MIYVRDGGNESERRIVHAWQASLLLCVDYDHDEAARN